MIMNDILSSVSKYTGGYEENCKHCQSSSRLRFTPKTSQIQSSRANHTIFMYTTLLPFPGEKF
jgi:hypothetical protein